MTSSAPAARACSRRTSASPTTAAAASPGLRREELAQLAGVSVDYYVRLEQGRDIQPSDSVLDAIATALRLDDAERAHLFALVRPRKRARRRASERVRPHVRDLVARMDFPAVVTGRRMDVLASNPIARALLCGMREPNMARLAFLDEGARVLFTDWDAVAADTVAFLRMTAAEDPDDAQLVELIGELSVHSPELPQAVGQARRQGQDVRRQALRPPAGRAARPALGVAQARRPRPDARDLHARRRRVRDRARAARDAMP